MKVKDFIEATNALQKESYESTGVLEHTEHIFATYFLEDDSIKSVQIFATAFVSAELDVQLAHTTDLLKFLTDTMKGLCDLTEDEANQTIKRLGLFDGTFVSGKESTAYDYLFKVKTQDGLILIAIAEM